MVGWKPMLCCSVVVAVAVLLGPHLLSEVS